VYETIRVENRGESIARIVLARPPLNVLNIAMLKELCDAVDELAERPRLRVVAIAAEGRVFSAGVDVEDHVDEKVGPMIAAFHGLFRRLADLETVTVAEVHGHALGGGCELAAFCDLVLASEDAAFGQPEIQLGLFPPITAAAFRYFVQGKKTLELMLTGERVDAREALRIGLVNQTWPAEDFADESASFIERLASRSGAALRLSKKAYYAAVDAPFHEALDRAERIYLQELMRTEDAREGIAAFRGKREPRWNDA
jgi:cyclohexa-1,5-dienecarbonyl-CoA hydratase